jgi:2-alkyl-3-oxoalkanoate reductase
MSDTVLVTGGTGFIGRTLVERLAAQANVRVVGRRPMVRWRLHPRVEHLRADISDQGVIERAVQGVNTVYHLAAATTGGWEAFQAVTIEASRRLLQILAAASSARVIFVSSLGNYDGGAMSPGVTIDEDFPLERASAGRGYYALAKTQAELAAHPFLLHHAIRLTIVRPGIVYGPGMKNPLTGVAFSLKGRAWIMLGNGNKPLPLAYIDDVADTLMKVAADQRTVGRIYNLVHSEQPIQNDYLRLYRQLSGDRRTLMRLPVQSLNPAFRMADFFNRKIRGRDSQYAYAVRRMTCEVRFSGERLLRETGIALQIAYREGLQRIFQTQRR